MCRNAISKTREPGPLPEVKVVPSQSPDMEPRREMFAERPNVGIQQIYGQWTDSNGCTVNVFSIDAYQAQLRATLVKPNGRETDLNLYATSDGWQCGAARLAAASEDQLWWMFRDGKCSIWERGQVTHFPQSSMVSESLVEPDKEERFTLSGCQSPMEAYFNPYPSGPRNSASAFFVGDDTHAQACHSFLNVSQVPPSMTEQQASPEKASLIGNVWAKARHKSGCREVQDALSSGDNCFRAAIASELRGHIWHSVECPNANHVLQKCIVEMCPEALQFMIDELTSWKGAGTYLAKHAFGCRVFQRLLEHCRPEQTQEMVSDVLANAGSICTHKFGNYGLQHIFEHGTKDQRQQLTAMLLPRMPRLCGDSSAVAVIAKGLEHAPAKEQRCIAQALLQEPGRFLQLAALRYGQAAVVALLKLSGPEAAEARKLLEKEADSMPLAGRGRQRGLRTSRHGRAVLKCCGLDEPKVQQLTQSVAANGGA